MPLHLPGSFNSVRVPMVLALLCIAGAHQVATGEKESGPATRSEQASAESGLANPGFEDAATDAAPVGWTIPAIPPFDVSVTEKQPKEGRHCATIVCRSEPGVNPFGNLMQRVDAAPFRGQRVRFRAAVRADVEGPRNQAQLWLRVDRKTADGARALGAFDNMGDRPITAATWNHYEIVADVDKDAQQITIGMMLLGQGQAWLDEVTLEVVAQDVTLTAKSPAGGGRSGTPLADIKPGLFEIQGAMRITPGSGWATLFRALAGNDESAHRQTVLMPLPLAYRDQVPLSYELTVDPRAAVEAVEIYEDSPHNFVLKVTLAEQRQGDHVDVNFKSTVLVGPSSFDAAPASAPIPGAWPEEAQAWLAATWCADSGHERIAALAAEIRADTSDVLEIIRRVQQTAGTIFRTAQGPFASLTAVDALDKRGSCTSCANLVAALLRAAGVPARVLSGYPSWSGPLQTHYIVEAYVPDYGWYPIESTLGQAPWPNTHQVHVAIIPPRHEVESKAGARLSAAGGVPYLSLTELPENSGSLLAVGAIAGSPGCDHECRIVRSVAGAPGEWRRAIAETTPRWQAWLGSTHELDDDGRLKFGKSSDALAAKSLEVLLDELDD